MLCRIHVANVYTYCAVYLHRRIVIERNICICAIGLCELSVGVYCKSPCIIVGLQLVNYILFYYYSFVYICI